uniref:Putative F-box/kelch-repeat protein n=1 Tax=Noccaea caerulescens TaxID=107243 RepID=A0A1J3GCN9_NOCCA
MFTDLPRELEWDILSRVPPISLNKFRSTFRRWYASRFTEKNLGKAGRPFILKKDFGVYSVNLNLYGIINDKSFDPSIEFTGTDDDI